MFGHQITYARRVFDAHSAPLDAGPETEPGAAATRVELAQQYGRVVMQIVVSLLVLAGSFVLMFTRGEDESMTNLAFSAIGVVVGYWLR